MMVSTDMRVRQLIDDISEDANITLELAKNMRKTSAEQKRLLKVYEFLRKASDEASLALAGL